ncbi:otopetrin-3 [Elysia marginata]|uniref:Otopetrin-3 n=1 Tax=Elysia marginata TaxID=1093978 RepID=A0AAV4IZ95_9GAST|nr:otopetrin-3 [Elysia marginata]
MDEVETAACADSNPAQLEKQDKASKVLPCRPQSVHRLEEDDAIASAENDSEYAGKRPRRLRKRGRTAMFSSPGASNHYTSLTSDDIDLNASHRTGAAADIPATANKDAVMPDAMKNSLMVILSGLYGLLLVVLGLVLPIAETFTDPTKTYSFELFYMYLYGVSMLFLLYVYTYLLRKEQNALLSITRKVSRTLSRSFSTKLATPSSSRRISPFQDKTKSTERTSSPARTGTPGIPLRRVSSLTFQRQSSTLSTASCRGRRKKIAYDADVSHHTGSFYLRVGVIGFGIGSMIHSSLTFGYFFEVNQSERKCRDILQAIKPFTHLIFTFVQMYFVFMNSKMCVHKYKTLARFGLMHMSGTNICVWLRSIVVETLLVIKMEKRKTYNERTKNGELSVKGL